MQLYFKGLICNSLKSNKNQCPINQFGIHNPCVLQRNKAHHTTSTYISCFKMLNENGIKATFIYKFLQLTFSVSLYFSLFVCLTVSLLLCLSLSCSLSVSLSLSLSLSNIYRQINKEYMYFFLDVD